jgi:hypothetical protein
MQLRNMLLVAGLGLVVACSLIAAASQEKPRKVDKAPLLVEEANPQDRSRDLLPGQEPRSQWEYKILGDAYQSSEKLQQAFNELGADGWEYAGPIRLFEALKDCAVFKRLHRK